MDIIINHQRHTLTPIRQFRAEYHLPDTFGIAHFEPKNFAGLGHIDGAGEALDTLRIAIIQALPPRLTTLPTHDFLEHIARLFENTLNAVNPVIGLRDVEIGYAVSGFSDILNNWLYDAIRASQTHTPPTPFDTLYADWLANSGRRSEKKYTYPYQGDEWTIRFLYNAYGRVGFQTDMHNTTMYVQDIIYVCPAEGFIHQLTREMVKKLTV
ncbi:MAG: hypothetical protein MUE54_03090 [Anaerolineae bacterium]|jgi:hypothetical protein|nr:hypothetical protein [Anaerolineae bacterium]